AGGAGSLGLSVADLGNLTDGFSSITIGAAAGTGLITVDAYTFTDPLTIRSPGVGGAITVEGALATTAANALTLTAGTGNAGLFTLASGSVSSTSGAITINADAIDIQTGVNTITSTGTLSIVPTTLARPVVIGAAGAATDLALSVAEVAAFTDGFSTITIGSARRPGPSRSARSRSRTRRRFKVGTSR